MENLFKNEDGYEVAKEKAKAAYKAMKRVWCPALKDEVIFNSAGFRHLIWKHGKHRFKGEQKRRFLLIPLAAEVLQKSEYATPTEINTGARRVCFWAVAHGRDNKVITVVVRQVEGHSKHFLSIFEGNKKSTPEE